MTPQEAKAYSEKYHVKRVERSCGTCKYFGRNYEESGCYNQKQADFDEYEQRLRKNIPDHINDPYGPYGCGVEVDEGFVCDLWEKGGAA